MRTELIKIHERISEQFNTSTIYVTHDQIEAMTMGDRIVVMRDGYIQQVDSPKEIYNNPKNMFVAGFMGTPPMNFIKGTIGADGYFVADSFKVQVPEGKLKVLKDNGYIGNLVVFGIRPEDISDLEIVATAYPNAVIETKLDLVELLGAETNLYFTINHKHVVASIETKEVKENDIVRLAFDMNKCHFFDPKTELVIK